MTRDELADMLRSCGEDDADAQRTLQRIAEHGLCSDCGTAPRWRHASGHYCRRCHRKNGYQEHWEIDPDKLDALVGVEMANKIRSECGYS